MLPLLYKKPAAMPQKKIFINRKIAHLAKYNELDVAATPSFHIRPDGID